MTTQEFNALPNNEKAVLVAKDVLEQVKAEKYIPNTGTYIHVFGDGFNFEGSIKDNFDQIQQCKVCALGSMLMSSTHLGNTLTTSDIDNYPEADDLRDSEKITELFSSIFTNKQLLLIETAFEGYSDFWGETKRQLEKRHEETPFQYYESSDRYSVETLTFEETLACEMFNRKYPDDDKRLIAICRNIIRNKGVFMP